MRLDPDAIKMLERNLAKAMSERERLTRELSDLNPQIDAMKTLIATATGQTETADAAENNDNTSLSATGSFLLARSTAEAIRLALQEYGRPAKPKDLRAFMHSHGFKWNRPKPFSLYVGPELFRMAAKPQSPVKKLGGGRYVYREV